MLRNSLQREDSSNKSRQGQCRADMTMIRIQALEWVQGQIQDLILNNVTTD